MSKLEEVVNDLMESIDEEYNAIKVFSKSKATVVEKQIQKLRETATTLLPVMNKILEEKYYFRGENTKHRSSKGPILKEDYSNNVLYVFSVERQIPIAINLYDEEVTNLSYRKLLSEVEFSTAMEGLLSVLNHHKFLMKEIQEHIDHLENELLKYE